jgi:hypothetical protein
MIRVKLLGVTDLGIKGPGDICSLHHSEGDLRTNTVATRLVRCACRETQRQARLHRVEGHARASGAKCASAREAERNGTDRRAEFDGTISPRLIMLFANKPSSTMMGNPKRSRDT